MKRIGCAAEQGPSNVRTISVSDIPIQVSEMPEIATRPTCVSAMTVGITPCLAAVVLVKAERGSHVRTTDDDQVPDSDGDW